MAGPVPTSRVGDFRTAASGNFTTAGLWEVFVAGPSGTAADGHFTATTAIPTDADGTILIQSGHRVALTTAASLNELYIEYGGTLEHTGTANLTITASVAGAGTDFSIQGTYRELSTSGRVVIAPGTTMLVEDTGIWRHSANGGTVPIGTWAPSSLLLFDGITTATALASTARLGQEFGRITWDCPAQTSTFALGPLSTESGNVFTRLIGDMTVSSTGTAPTVGTLQLSSPTKRVAFEVGGGYEQFSGRVVVNANAGTTTTLGGPRPLNVSTDFTLHGGTFTVTTATNPTATGTLTVLGGINLLGGTLNITQSARPGSVAVTGAVSLASGSLLRTANTGTATFNFAQGPSRLYSNLGTVTGAILFNVNPGATVDFGTHTLSGAGAFTLSEGAVAYLASPGGITALGHSDAAQGNIRVASLRAYSQLGYYMYTGTQAQKTGSGLPATIGTTSDSLNGGGLGIVNPGGNVTLTQNLLLHGELLLEQGHLVSVPDSLLTISTSGFLNSPNSGSAASHVEGVMAREMDEEQAEYLFPVGDNGDYRPVTMRLNNPTGSATYRLGARRETLPNSTLLADAGDERVDALLGDTYWLTARTAGTTDGVMRIAYDSAITPDIALLTIAGFNPISNRWENLGLVARDSGARWVEAVVPPPYTMVSLARGPVDPLPVELVLFGAERRGSVVLLNWLTASEQNSEWFVVERSADGREFTEIAWVAAAGNSARPLDYAATDDKPLARLAYYRLRQIDRDGQTAFSDIVAVNGGATSVQPLALYPNPATDNVTVRLPAPAANTVIRVVNSVGQVVLTHTPAATDGQCDLALGSLPSGVYTITVTAPGHPMVAQRLLKSNP